MKAFAKILLFFGICVGVFSCNTSGCLDNQSAIPLAGLYSSETGQSISLNIIEISGVGAPGDSVLVAAGTAVQQVYLPMRSTVDETSWCIHYTQENLSDPALNDTVTFGYESQPYFASEECGASYRYYINSVKCTTHLLDSVVLADSLITNADIERIRLYFKTAVPDEPEIPETE